MNHYYECQCHSDEHRVAWWIEGREKNFEPMIGFSVFLSDYPSFWVRIWNAVKYVFGYKCKYGHFDCFLLRNEDVDNMIKMLEGYKKL
jgi:hypothetical protein